MKKTGVDRFAAKITLTKDTFSAILPFFSRWNTIIIECTVSLFHSYLYKLFIKWPQARSSKSDPIFSKSSTDPPRWL